MWNQGNGNQGYGNRGYSQDVYDGLNSTKEVGKPKFPFIEDGKHKFALCSLDEFQHATDGPSARALFEVIESNKHPIGSYVVKIWKLMKQPKFQNKDSDGVLFTDFCRKLKGAPVSHVMSNDIRVLMKERANEQLARGTVIECVAILNKKGTWTDIYWNSIKQSPEDIAAMRQRLEQRGIPDSGGAPQQPAQNQYTNAPHPSQMPGQYPAQQYGQPQNMMTYAPTTGTVGPDPQPIPVQQGYGQPQPPQGGFLASVPIKPQGGNGGQGAW